VEGDKYMEIILLEEVKGLGKKGDVVKVAAGYARNYLLPRKLAVEASVKKIKALQEQKKAITDKNIKEEVAAKGMVQKLDGLTIQVAGKVGESGKLFGAVSSKDIVSALFKNHGLEVDKKKLLLKEPIKNLGTHLVTVKLHHKAQAQIKVNVVAEKKA
jgi:large subunit ribosomal protein L9